MIPYLRQNDLFLLIKKLFFQIILYYIISLFFFSIFSLTLSLLSFLLSLIFLFTRHTLFFYPLCHLLSPSLVSFYCLVPLYSLSIPSLLPHCLFFIFFPVSFYFYNVDIFNNYNKCGY